ncbi:hypothetical protein BDR04DRAFT_1117222 [Suillus decipiens]|nr:hypothetical protein BDR04DRAFT_1117222 [Suillus decipiens]
MPAKNAGENSSTPPNWSGHRAASAWNVTVIVIGKDANTTRTCKNDLSSSEEQDVIKTGFFAGGVNVPGGKGLQSANPVHAGKVAKLGDWYPDSINALFYLMIHLQGEYITGSHSIVPGFDCQDIYSAMALFVVSAAVYVLIMGTQTMNPTTRMRERFLWVSGIAEEPRVSLTGSTFQASTGRNHERLMGIWLRVEAWGSWAVVCLMPFYRMYSFSTPSPVRTFLPVYVRTAAYTRHSGLDDVILTGYEKVWQAYSHWDFLLQDFAHPDDMAAISAKWAQAYEEGAYLKLHAVPQAPPENPAWFQPEYDGE